MIEFLSTAVIKKKNKKWTNQKGPIFWFWFDVEKNHKIPAFRSKQGSMIHSEPETQFGVPHY